MQKACKENQKVTLEDKKGSTAALKEPHQARERQLHGAALPQSSPRKQAAAPQAKRAFVQPTRHSPRGAGGAADPTCPGAGPSSPCSLRSGAEALAEAEIVECGGLHQKANGELGRLNLPCLQVPPFPEVKEAVEDDLLACISKRH